MKAPAVRVLRARLSAKIHAAEQARKDRITSEVESGRAARAVARERVSAAFFAAVKKDPAKFFKLELGEWLHIDVSELASETLRKLRNEHPCLKAQAAAGGHGTCIEFPALGFSIACSEEVRDKFAPLAKGIDDAFITEDSEALAALIAKF
jgi:hypothetical protein